MTRRRWRQLGWAGAVLAALWFTLFAVTSFFSVWATANVRVKLWSVIHISDEQRVGIWVDVRHGGLFLRWKAVVRPDTEKLYLQVKADITSIDRKFRFFLASFSSDEVALGWVYPFVFGLCLVVIGRWRGREVLATSAFSIESVGDE